MLCSRRQCFLAAFFCIFCFCSVNLRPCSWVTGGRPRSVARWLGDGVTIDRCSISIIISASARNDTRAAGTEGETKNTSDCLGGARSLFVEVPATGQPPGPQQTHTRTHRKLTTQTPARMFGAIGFHLTPSKVASQLATRTDTTFYSGPKRFGSSQ